MASSEGLMLPGCFGAFLVFLMRFFFSGVCQSVAINSAFWVSDDMMKT